MLTRRSLDYDRNLSVTTRFLNVLAATTLAVAGLSLLPVTAAAHGVRARCGTRSRVQPPEARSSVQIQFRGLRHAAIPVGEVVLVVTSGTPGPVLITGERCADGSPIRFWFGNDAPWDYARTQGNLSYALVGKPGLTQIGYLSWSKPGLWKVTVSRAGHTLASAVFCVAPSYRSNGRCG